MMRKWFFGFLLLSPCWAEPSSHRPLGLRFPCHLDLLPTEAYRPHTADYMWPLKVTSPKGWSYAKGPHSFQAPLSDAELEKVVVEFVRAQYP